ncbi:MAG: hypothetical protein LBI05_02385, partial [Planctomycetaceae bacterium]|nr:hypothetical protein [Planctomycetaceae bacterium]
KKAPTFEKEILSETVIVKRGKEYPITPEFLDNCVVQYRRMKKGGVKVNVHSGHTHTPETKRGEVLDMYTRRRRDGRVGLFGKICFLPHLSKQTIQTLVSNDVSVELPKTLCDAKGNFYPFPVQRVAITPDPAVSGMSPFVPQQDTAMDVPYLTLSMNNFLPEENDTMPNDTPELFEPHGEVNDQSLPDTGMDAAGNDDAQQALATGSNQSTFISSQFAKTLFDSLGIDPEDYDEQEDLINELTLRLTSMLTIQSRLLAALDIDEGDRNKFELLTTKITALVDFLDQYDHDDDGIVDEEDIQQGAQPTIGDGSGDDNTIDGTLNKLESNDQNLQLSLNSLQKRYAESATVIKSLVSQNRQLRLDNMLQAGEINKVTHQKAVKKFVLKLSLNDGFDDFIDGAKTNSHRIGGHSKTPPQQAPAKVDATASWANAARKISAPYARAEE